jgi:hypothetical protein
MNTRAMRRRFLHGLLLTLRVVWPILSGVFVLIVGLGMVAGLFEGWSIQDSIYFSFVTGLTIGYGDFAPKTLPARVISVLVGMCGIALTGIVAAIAVKAITSMQDTSDD